MTSGGLFEMRCSVRLAKDEEAQRILEASASDYALSQTSAFGHALARAFPEYAYRPTIFDFEDGQVYLPLVSVRRWPAFVGCYESMPLSLSGAPAFVGGASTPWHLSAVLRVLDPGQLLISVGATSRPRWPPLEGRSLKSRGGETHLLRLESGFDAVWERSFSGKVRNQCRLADRKGVTVRDATDELDYDAYRTLYEASAERWGYKVPPYPTSLFRELATLHGRGVDLKLAYVGTKAVAGIVLFRGRRSVLYWSGALLKEYADYCPNNALLRTAIAEACRRGDTCFDFGASGALDSVRRYKESFGAERVPTSTYVYSSPTYRALEFAKAAWRRATGHS